MDEKREAELADVKFTIGVIALWIRREVPSVHDKLPNLDLADGLDFGVFLVFFLYLLIKPFLFGVFDILKELLFFTREILLSNSVLLQTLDKEGSFDELVRQHPVIVSPVHSEEMHVVSEVTGLFRKRTRVVFIERLNVHDFGLSPLLVPHFSFVDIRGVVASVQKWESVQLALFLHHHLSFFRLFALHYYFIKFPRENHIPYSSN